nr:MAG TPA: hypothetical protein [Caudoviricetes sp.]
MKAGKNLVPKGARLFFVFGARNIFEENLKKVLTSYVTCGMVLVSKGGDPGRQSQTGRASGRGRIGGKSDGKRKEVC